MPGSTVRAPWSLARSAQAAIVAAAVADVAQVWELGAIRLRPLTAPASDPLYFPQIYVWAMTVAAALFLVWFAQCRRNADLISPGAVKGTVGWAVVVWLLPVFNLWAPRGLVVDVQRASSAPDAAPRRGEVLVNVWWTVWTGHTIAHFTLTGLGGGTSLPSLVAVESFQLLAAALAVVVIQRVTARQAAALGPGVPAPAPAVLPHGS
ncbi:DUF4328 domain-containing protein [Streptomyces bungoensis]